MGVLITAVGIPQIFRQVEEGIKCQDKLNLKRRAGLAHCCTVQSDEYEAFLGAQDLMTLVIIFVC